MVLSDSVHSLNIEAALACVANMSTRVFHQVTDYRKGTPSYYLIYTSFLIFAPVSGRGVFR